MLEKKGQISLTVIWMLVALVGLVVAVLILFFTKDTGESYLAKFWDCLRFGGKCWG